MRDMALWLFPALLLLSLVRCCASCCSLSLPRNPMEGRRHRIYQSFKQRGLMVRPEALDYLAKRELSNDKVALWLSSIKKQSRACVRPLSIGARVPYRQCLAARRGCVLLLPWLPYSQEWRGGCAGARGDVGAPRERAASADARRVCASSAERTLACRRGRVRHAGLALRPRDRALREVRLGLGLVFVLRSIVADSLLAPPGSKASPASTARRTSAPSRNGSGSSASSSAWRAIRASVQCNNRPHCNSSRQVQDGMAVIGVLRCTLTNARTQRRPGRRIAAGAGAGAAGHVAYVLGAGNLGSLLLLKRSNSFVALTSSTAVLTRHNSRKVGILSRIWIAR